MSAKSRQSLFRAKLAQHILSASKGFTLIELLVVIVIVGVLSAVAIPQFLNQVRRSRTAEAQAALTAVGRGSEVYRLDVGVYPDTTPEFSSDVLPLVGLIPAALGAISL
jgi:prepilin-type N-terminal cleavage/methylation domain-containing protein